MKLIINPDQTSLIKAMQTGYDMDDFRYDRVTAKLYTDYPDEYYMVKIYGKLSNPKSIVTYDDQRFTGGEYRESGEIIGELRESFDSFVTARLLE